MNTCSRSERKMSLGIYIHIPFCRTKCNYCHFVIRPWKEAAAERYQRALVREIRQFLCEAKLTAEVDSIFFGGGTPSLIPVEYIEEVLDVCRRYLSVSEGCEISLEANPGTLLPDTVSSYREMGINRVSVGAQSFDDGRLAAIGRDHTGDQVKGSVALLREGGIDNINLDLMLGLPDQTEECWETDMEAVAALFPAHLSLYMLDLDEKSPLYHYVARERCALPEDDFVADLYLRTRARLAASGYEQYEISNFALPGRECRHNLKYWLREPVLGFGVGSHSYDGACRHANFRSMNAYLEAVEAGVTAIEWREPVTPSHALGEKMFLGLRLCRGLDWRCLRDECESGQKASFESSLSELTGEGLLEWQDSTVRLTPRGMLLSNEVFQRFI